MAACDQDVPTENVLHGLRFPEEGAISSLMALGHLPSGVKEDAILVGATLYFYIVARDRWL